MKGIREFKQLGPGALAGQEHHRILRRFAVRPDSASAPGAVTGQGSHHLRKLSTLADRLFALPCSIWPADHARCDLVTKFGKFMAVGATGVLVNTIVLFILYDQLRLSLIASSVASVEVAIASNFFWNNLWTFRTPDHVLSRFIRFNVVSLGGLAITTASVWILVTYLDSYYLVANLIGISLATTWNFALNLIWTWGWSSG